MTQNVRNLKATTTGRKQTPITETEEKETSSESTEKS